jgi:recombination protein RecA
MAIQIKKTDVGTTAPEPEAMQSIASTIEGEPDSVPVEVDSTKKKKVSAGGGELSAIMAQIRKEKGDKVVNRGSEIPLIERIQTGVFEFDLATGGGFPRGRYSIVYGPESSGKTNICYCAASQAQRMPDPCNKVVWVDLEGTFSHDWAAQFGIDVEELIVVRPSYGEEAVDLIDALVRAEDVALLVVDSIATVVSSKEIGQSVEKFDVGTSSLLIKRLCNKLVIALATESKRGHTPAVVLVNQTRFKIGVMFGDPESMPGGQTMKFLSSLTVRLYGKNKIEESISSELPAFKETTAVIKKAKVGVTKYNFDYDLCMFPHNGLSVGETRSWNTVSGYLKDLGYLKKAEKGTGWELLGKTYQTLVTIRGIYESDDSFKLQLQKMVIDSFKGKSFIVEADGAAK